LRVDDAIEAVVLRVVAPGAIAAAVAAEGEVANQQRNQVREALMRDLQSSDNMMPPTPSPTPGCRTSPTRSTTATCSSQPAAAFASTARRSTSRSSLPGRRRHLDRQLYALRSRLYRLGSKNLTAPRQPLRPKVVTHVLGTFCYPCLRAGQR
jgi:hypothetical protein